MIRHLKSSLFSYLIITAVAFPASSVFAGNQDRSGTAGATELLINPWARSAGWAGANQAGIHGLEAQFLNPAGIAFTKKTELVFAHTIYLSGSDIGINTFGLSQRVGESSVLAIGIMAMDFGDIPVTTALQPEGGLGTYSPTYINIGVSYAKEFSNRIYGGITFRIISQSLADVKASGLAFDAGVQYVTGNNENKDNMKFGMSLRNVGAPMRFSGDGLSYRGLSPDLQTQLTVNSKADKFELPSLIHIGGMYDIEVAADHRISIAADFTANSFSNDQFALGVEYGFKTYLMFRAGFVYENDIFDSELRTTAMLGPAIGLTLDAPLGKDGKSFGFDYAYRSTNPFNGIHSLGVRINL